MVIYERTENDKDGEVIGSLRGKRNREDDDDDDLDDDEYDDEAGLEVEGAEGDDNGEQQEMVVDGDDSEQGSSDVDEEQAEFAHLDNRVNVIVDDYIHLMEGKGSDPGLAKAYKAVQSSHENCEKAEVMDAQLIGKFKATVEALEEKLEKYLDVNPDERKRKAPKKKAKAAVEAEEDEDDNKAEQHHQEVPEGAEIVYEGWNASADKEKSQLFIDQLLASLQALLDIGDMVPGWVDKERQLIVNKFALQLGQFSDPGIVTRFGEKRMAEFNKTAEDLKVMV